MRLGGKRAQLDLEGEIKPLGGRDRLGDWLTDNLRNGVRMYGIVKGQLDITYVILVQTVGGWDKLKGRSEDARMYRARDESRRESVKHAVHKRSPFGWTLSPASPAG